MAKITTIEICLVLFLSFAITSCVKDEITHVNLNKSTLTLRVGQTDSIVATIRTTGDINNPAIELTSNDTSIVNASERVNSERSTTKKILITAVAEGTATLTVKAGNKTASCQVTVTQTNYAFNKAIVANYGDFYDTNNNTFDIYLLQNSLSVDTGGVISGTGTMLYIEFTLPITQNTVSTGSFILSDTATANTFKPGRFEIYSGDTIISGTRIINVSEKGSTYTLIKEGSYTVALDGGVYIIQGTLIAESNELIYFSFSGQISVTDKREPVVKIYPDFTKGQLIYYGDAYDSKSSNNFVAYLATKNVNFADSTINGELLALELNTTLAATTALPDGTYNMMSELTVGKLIPNSLVPGYTSSDGNHWGCWYYGNTSKSLRTGNAIVAKSGDRYTISYNLYDRYGSMVSGIYTGPLDYYNGTSSSGAPVYKAGKMHRNKSFININKGELNMKTFVLRKE